MASIWHNNICKYALSNTPCTTYLENNKHVWLIPNMCGFYNVWVFPHMSGFNQTCDNSYQCVGFSTHVCRLPQKTENRAPVKRCTSIMPPQPLKP